MTRAARRMRGTRGHPTWAVSAAVALYVLLALLAFWPVSPVSSTTVPSCACGDQAQEVWFLAWMAHALRSGTNPFFTSYIDYPRGVNLALNTSMPLLGLLAAPLTFLHGAIASYNLLMRLAFVASATSMLLVMRRFCTGTLAPAIAGLLYGFSPYMVGQGNGHLFLLFVPLPPLMLLAVFDLATRHTTRRTATGHTTRHSATGHSATGHTATGHTARRTGLLLGLASAAQYLIAQEILVTTAICALIGLAYAAARRPRAVRARLGHLGAGLCWALAVFAPIVAYPAWFFLRGPEHVVGPPHVVSALAHYRADLLGPIVPTLDQMIGPTSLVRLGTRFGGANPAENGIYLGIPLVLVLVAVVVRYRRDLLVATVAAVGLCCFVLALGSPLTIDGHATAVPLPFALLRKAPLLGGVLASRFSLYVDLCAAVLLGLGLDRLLAARRAARLAAAKPGTGRRRRRAAPPWRATALAAVLVVAVLVPLVPRFPYAHQVAEIPPYFSSPAVRQIPPGSVVLSYPYDYTPYNDAMLWQAATAMRFEIVGGEATRPGRDGAGTSAVLPLAPTETQNLFRAGLLGTASPVPAPPLDPAGLERVRTLLTRWGIETVVLDPVGVDPALIVRYLTVALGRPPVETGGVDVWYHADQLAAAQG
ncbi:MAG: hypothetical protein ACYCXY_01835 [Acidimicrobiales bacterium]